ncbi:uncharacterized protein LOC128861255 [Anastrepha ludens]|uniref:uncharacterized protein LOC128861255 n=1 Tax=Anastrepha ludens TaxID=28586 RepID=UPI0023B1B5BB|nr:uncharacterized protein LOC128861255 [Anastrepha ludens]
MYSPSAQHFTLQQLANIALGCEQMTGVNTVVLHSLLNLVLKKLNCQNEKVSISGYEAKQMAELLETAHTSPIIFHEENFNVVLERFENLDELEKRLDAAEVQLKEHLLGIRRYLSKLENLEPCRFDENDYYELCEDSCSTPNPDVKATCDMLSRTSFLKNILLHIYHPIVKAYFAIEDKLNALQKAMCMLIQRLDLTLNSFALINSVESEFEWSSLEFDRLHLGFIKALNEIQDILDAKADKFQMVQLKDYIAERFDLIWNKLNKLLKEGRCQEASAVIFEDRKSVPTTTTRKIKPKIKCTCGGVHLSSIREQKLLDRIKRIDIERVKALLETKGRRSYYLPMS